MPSQEAENNQGRSGPRILAPIQSPADSGRPQPWWQVDIAEDARPVHQGRVLEHEADARGLDRKIAGERAGGDFVETGDEPQCRRFAAARRAKERQELARQHIEIEPGKRHRSGLIDFASILEGEEKLCHRRHDASYGIKVASRKSLA